jgi:hypothetical protein
MGSLGNYVCNVITLILRIVCVVCTVYDALYCHTVQRESRWKVIRVVCHCQLMSQVQFIEPSSVTSSSSTIHASKQ